MSRTFLAKRTLSSAHRRSRPIVENLESRSLPAIGFLSGFGVGVVGQYAAIRSNAVATDSLGDTWVTGSFRGTISLDPNSSSGTFTSNGTQDTFVVKYSKTGAMVWASTFAGQVTNVPGVGTTTAVSQGSAIAVDSSGNVFIAGGFSGQVNFATATGLTSIVAPTSTTEVYLAKLDPNGHVVWVDAVSGTTGDDDEAYALSLDGAGGAVVAGSFEDSASFGSIKLNASGMFDAFASRVDGLGNFLWAVSTQGSAGSNAEIHGLAVDPSGNIGLTGFFSGTVDFDPSSTLSSLTSADSDDAVLWKLDRNGHYVWSRAYGSTDYDASTAVAVDSSGNFYATGAFAGSVNFGTNAHPDLLTAGPIFDTFVVKVDPNGNEVWVKGLVGPGGWSKGQGVAIDPTGEVNLTGTFQGTVDFDPNSGIDNLTSVGNTDVFVEGLDSTGALIYAFQAGTTNFNAGLGIAVNAGGIASITGTYNGSIAFGSTNVPAAGLANVFVAQVSTQPPPPVSPSTPVLEASSDTGLSHTDGITSDTTPILDVLTASPGNTVRLLRNGVVVGQRIGPGPIMDPGPIIDGTYTYTAIQAFPNGVTSPISAASSVTIDTNPPSAPSAPLLFSSDDTGIVGDGITSVRQPRLSVVAQAGTTTQLIENSGSVVATVFSPNGGTYLLTPSQPLVDGVVTFQANAIDLAGNVGPLSPSTTLTILSTPPAPPPAPTLLNLDVTGPPGSNLTSVRQPRITGTAKAGTTVKILNVTTGSILGTGASNGVYTAKVSSPLADGRLTVDVVAVDAAGNTSQASPGLSFTIDTTPPSAPGLLTLLAADDSGTAGDSITNVRQPRLTGSAEVGALVQVFDGSGKLDGSSTASAVDGSFTIKLTTPLVDASYSFQARTTDLAGNVGPLGSPLKLTILGTPPAAPGPLTIVPADDSGGPGLTNVRQPRLSGTAPANTVVEILGSSGAILGTSPSGSTGAFVVKLSSPLADGTYPLDALAVDVAGNTSLAGPTLSLKILANPPVAPSLPGLLAADDSGTLGDSITNVRQPRIISTAAAGLTVKLENGSNVVLGLATATTAGSVTIAPSTALVDGSYPLHLVAGDAAGNNSLSSGLINLVILATAPATPAAPSLFAGDDTGPVSDGVTQVRRPRVVGTAAPGTRVDWIASNGTSLGSTTASALNGSYQLQPLNALINATYPVKIRLTDIAGNVSGLSPALNLTIRAISGDYFADGRTDVGVFQLNPDYFLFLRPPSNGLYQIPYGIPGDIPVNGDFFGDGRDDLAFYRPSTSTFYAYDLLNAATKVVQLGQTGDVPVPADFDGDGKTDFAVFRPSNGTWYVLMSSTNTIFTQLFAYPGDTPVPADYFGNGHADYAVYHSSTASFYVFDPISNGFQLVPLGIPGDIPVPADYEGLGHADFAVFQPSDLTWSILMSATNTVVSRGWGILGDYPVFGDYFGDGRNDLTVYRTSTSTFFELNLFTNAVQVNQVGTPGQVKPLQGPITTWFNFGGSGMNRAITVRTNKPAASTTSGFVVAIIPELTAASPSSLATSSKLGGRSSQNLSLERWRHRV